MDYMEKSDTRRCNMAARGCIGNDRNEFIGPENVGLDTKITNLCCLQSDMMVTMMTNIN